MQKLINHEWNGPCMDAGKRAERIFKLALPYLRRWGSRWGYALEWAKDWLPVLVQDRGADWVEQAWSRLPRWPKLPESDRIAKLFGVTAELRCDLGLRSIAEVARPKAKREADERERRAQAERDRRAKHRPEVQPSKPESISQMKPWEAEGIGRSTWYARKADAEAAARQAAVTQPNAPVLSSVLAQEAAPILVKRASRCATVERVQQAVLGSPKLSEKPLGPHVQWRANTLERLPF